LNFSFSGLKTAILYFIQNEKAKDPEFVTKNLPDICASIQSRIVSILLNKLKMAAAQTVFARYARRWRLPTGLR
jgi:N6-L-threonylcarbamoyladenine synthase